MSMSDTEGGKKEKRDSRKNKDFTFPDQKKNVEIEG